MKKYGPLTQLEIDGIFLLEMMKQGYCLRTLSRNENGLS